jgi:3-ketoacyl-CoA synthase
VPAHTQEAWLAAVGGLLLALLVSLLRPSSLRRPRPPTIQLLDFAVCLPDPAWRFPRSLLPVLLEGMISPEDVAFQHKVVMRSGLGEHTSATPAILSGKYAEPGATSIEVCRDEFRATCLTTVQELLDKTGVKPHEIDFVVTNCSLFNPTPSLSATIMNHFKMPATTRNFSLGGMGCSAGLVAVDLARSLLELQPGTRALVVSHENITNAWYAGNDRSMMVPNCIFRANGAAILLSSRPGDARRAKYSLRHLLRTNLAADDEAFHCVYQTVDAQAGVGVRLGKELMCVAARALKVNLTALGPKVLPLSEQAKFGANLVVRQLARRSKALARRLPASWTQPYVPAFSKAFNHVCIHTGGRGVIDTIQKQLNLSYDSAEPSRAALYRFGNTSSASIWYCLAFIEHFKGVRRGDAVWQLAFGSGFKVNSAVWVANRRLAEGTHRAWDGFDAAAMRADLEELEAAVAAERAARQAAAAAAAAAAGADSSSDSTSRGDAAGSKQQDQQQRQAPGKVAA